MGIVFLNLTTEYSVTNLIYKTVTPNIFIHNTSCKVTIYGVKESFV